MIKFKRGTTKNWSKLKTPLADGQPGYDRDKHKIKVGDGINTWANLPYASGLHADEIVVEESKAEKDTPFTYGKKSPDEDTLGKVYLQHYKTDPETDYIVSNGIYKGWTYQKWHSGIARCWGTFKLSTEINSELEGLNTIWRSNTSFKKVSYPFNFTGIPSETATVHGNDTLSWLASKNKNTEKATAAYYIVSLGKSDSEIEFTISIQVEGSYK